jgi:hypothetical protein
LFESLGWKRIVAIEALVCSPHLCAGNYTDLDQVVIDKKNVQILDSVREMGRSEPDFPNSPDKPPQKNSDQNTGSDNIVYNLKKKYIKNNKK